MVLVGKSGQEAWAEGKEGAGNLTSGGELRTEGVFVSTSGKSIEESPCWAFVFGGGKREGKWRLFLMRVFVCVRARLVAMGRVCLCTRVHVLHSNRFACVWFVSLSNIVSLLADLAFLLANGLDAPSGQAGAWRLRGPRVLEHSFLTPRPW